MLSDILKKRESEIVALLVMLGDFRLVDENKGYKYENVDPECLGIDEAKIEAYRKLWPNGLKGSPGLVRKNMARLLTEGYKLEQIVRCAHMWLQKKEAPYCGQADYFLYKQVDKVWTSKFKQVMEAISEVKLNMDYVGS